MKEKYAESLQHTTSRWQYHCDICAEVPPGSDLDITHKNHRNLRNCCKKIKSYRLSRERCVRITFIFLVSISPYMRVAQFVGMLKSKSARTTFDGHTNLKYKYGSRNSWCREYYVDTVEKNAISKTSWKKIWWVSISLKENMDSFTGSKRKQTKESSRF